VLPAVIALIAENTGPINLVPVAAGIVIGIGNTSLGFSSTFSLSGIAFGTIVAIAAYHMARALAPQHMKDSVPLGRSSWSAARTTRRTSSTFTREWEHRTEVCQVDTSTVPRFVRSTRARYLGLSGRHEHGT
jgi:hypothetical protein